ncbi:RNA pseudouridylate synthase domain containing protein 2, variant 2 [Balamuthia mandrillaris]
MNPQRRRARLLLLHCLPSPSSSSPAACSFYATNVACASLLNPWSRRGGSRPILALTPRQRVKQPPSGFPPSCRPTRSSTFFSRTSSYSTSAGTTLTGNLSVGDEDPQPPPNEASEATNTTTTTAWKETQRKIQACLEERKAAREAQYDVQPVYYFDRRLNARHVEPYYFCYHTTVKASWQGLTLRQVINTFVHHNNDYFEWAVENGKITLNGERTEPDAVLRNGYIIQHQTHVHEAPVTAEPIEILPDTDEEVLAVNKPPGIPVHPVARYRFNSVQHVLAFEHGLFPLYGFHRLDLPTSGILLFARTLDTAQTLANDVRERQLEKVYYARVAGNFPEGEKEVSSPLYVEPRLGASVVDETLGRTSKTIFHKEAYDPRSNTSLVRCVPVTDTSSFAMVRTSHSKRLSIRREWLIRRGLLATPQTSLQGHGCSTQRR